MYIKIDSDSASAIFNDAVLPPDDERDCDVEDYHVEFSDRGIAQVKQAVGEAYIEHYDEITKHETDS